VTVFEPVIQALHDAEVRYIVVGGLAVLLHGHARLTADIDIVIDLEPSPARRAIGALLALGLKARPPVDPYDFAKPAVREEWIREKNMTVFSFWDPGNPLREVDLFSRYPLDFEQLWHRSVVVPLGATSVRIASLPDLITMKKAAGRPQDLEDVSALSKLVR